MNIERYIDASFTGLWVHTREPEEALRDIRETCQAHSSKKHQWRCIVWDGDRGLQLDGQQGDDIRDPIPAIRALAQFSSTDIEDATLLVLKNLDLYLQNPDLIQALANGVWLGRHNRTFLVVLSPSATIGPHLEKLFVVVEHEMPDAKAIEDIVKAVATDPDTEKLACDNLSGVTIAAAGLTRFEVEGATALSLATHGTVKPDEMVKIKAGMLKKSGLLELHIGKETYESLGGLASVKDFCKRALRPEKTIASKGVMLLSPPGCGKSCFAKSLGNETGRPCLLFDVGTVFGSLVGQSEERIRQALDVADAMAPCILFLDEVEKALSGVQSSGQTDSGVTARVFGTFLTWLNDHESDVFVVATCNDISKLPPEFSRAERFDGIFFIDLPGRAEKDTIWRIHRDAYQIPIKNARPTDDSWTGAEIKSCCRLAALLGIPLIEAAQYVVPVAITASDKVQALRNWASGRCLDANLGGIYTINQAQAPARRLVAKKGESN